MVCPGCGAADSRVVKTMKSRINYRQRQCPCGIEWSTTETVEKGSVRQIHGVFRDQIAPALAAEVIARDGGKCRYCGSSDEKLGIDHVIPICAPIPSGRTREEETTVRNAIDNLAACCVRCNSAKRDTVNGKRVSRQYSVGQAAANGYKAIPAAPGRDQSRPTEPNRTGLSDPGSDLRSVPISSPSSSLPDPDPPKQPDKLADHTRWTPGEWKHRFGLSWAMALHRGARHYGERGDGKACGDLGDLLDSLPEADVFEAQARSSEMFAEYLAGRAPAVVQAGHCFAFFVTRWGALRIPAADRPKAEGKPNGHDPRIGHARAEVKTRPTGEVDL